MPNIGIAAGHSALRRAVMKERASASAATPEELVALAGACAGHPGTSIEFIPASSAYGFTDDDLELMASISVAARRPLNWNTVLLDYPAIPDLPDRQLRSADVGAAADQGSNAMFRDSLDRQLVGDTGHPALVPLIGRRVADIAAERGTALVETFFDLAVESRLDIGFVRYLATCDTPERRALRRRVLRDTRVVLGASDGGAHTQGIINVEYSTACFAELVRDDDVFTLEEMVQELTDVPARLYGLRDRGRLEEGAWADIVVFDPETIAPSPVGFVRDLPGGAGRLFSHGLGIDAVLVAGEPVVEKGTFTGATPGALLRSGRDTVTTPSDQLLARQRAGVADRP